MRHWFLDVPIGMPFAKVLEAAGRLLSELGDEMLLNGGLGWCFEIEESAAEFGVTKRTNCVLALDRELAVENSPGDRRVNVFSAREWTADHEIEPTTLNVDAVRNPLSSNLAFEGIVARSRLYVSEGDSVEEGEMIASPNEEGINNIQHVSIDGTVTEVTNTHIEIRKSADTGKRR